MCALEGCEIPVPSDKASYCGRQHLNTASRRRRVAARHAAGLTSAGRVPRPGGGRPEPLDDIDPVAVMLVCNGDRGVPLNRGERLAAVRELTLRGRSATQIADALGCSPKNVERLRHLLKESTT